MMTQALPALRAFHAEERGSVAIMAGMSFAVLTMLAGAAIDYARVNHAQSRFAYAADAAALAAGKALLDGRVTAEEAQDLAAKMFDENLKSSGKGLAKVKTLTIDIDTAAHGVTVRATAEVPMSFTAIAGIEKIDVPVLAATTYNLQDIEVGMALDVTGSMYGTKIAALRDAARDFVDIMLPDSPKGGKVRIGLAPYSYSVNAGDFAKTVTGGASTSCVHERGSSERYTDATPEGADVLGHTPGLLCPTAKIEPLTGDKNVLKTAIGGYQASGATAGHIGAAWAWYLVSPNWADVWPAASKPVAYKSTTKKVVVLMTDGEFNTWYLGGNGNSSHQAKQVCAEMKDQDVVVYSVAFQSPPAAEALLRQCATSKDHYFSAADADELRQAFQNIASNLNNLRLTQ